ncbi:hypothetical protein ALC57_16111 [Trachymyrmex cornetzi]|uniref:Uncharacterized protein n=1 Tax=Trachymyrmex cornetzi TaxID=471704 RepID=A0A151IVJ3_9HYME|nr:hypothetical protein ALC57_16111 [Trachymyrmex cornetzi]
MRSPSSLLFRKKKKKIFFDTPSTQIITYAKARVSSQPDAHNVRGFIVVTQTTGTPGSPDVFIVGLAIPLPKLFCFDAPRGCCRRSCAGFRSRVCESFTVKSNRANEKGRRKLRSLTGSIATGDLSSRAELRAHKYESAVARMLFYDHVYTSDRAELRIVSQTLRELSLHSRSNSVDSEDRRMIDGISKANHCNDRTKGPPPLIFLFTFVTCVASRIE